MSDRDIHALSGAYTLDAVDDVERARFQAHMARCSQCRDEVASLRATATEMTGITLSTPQATLRASVLRAISSVRPLPPLVIPEQEAPSQPAGSAATPLASASIESERAERSYRGRRWLSGAAAAVVLATGALVWHPWSTGTSSVQLTATQQVLQARDVQRFEAKVGGATATIVRSTSLRKAVIVTTNMPTTAQGKVYELWLQQGKTMVKAGLMPAGPSNTVLLQGDAAAATGVGITIEPTGGSETPTLPPVALISFA